MVLEQSERLAWNGFGITLCKSVYKMWSFPLITHISSTQLRADISYEHLPRLK